MFEFYHCNAVILRLAVKTVTSFFGKLTRHLCRCSGRVLGCDQDSGLAINVKMVYHEMKHSTFHRLQDYPSKICLKIQLSCKSLFSLIDAEMKNPLLLFQQVNRECPADNLANDKNIVVGLHEISGNKMTVIICFICQLSDSVLTLNK